MMIPPPDPAPAVLRAADVPLTLRGQLVADGMSDRSIKRACEAGVLARVRHGAYADGPMHARLDEAQRHALRTRAVLLQARSEAAASHVSAAIEYGAPTWGLDLSDTHITRLDGRAGRREGGVRQHRGVVRDGDVVERNGIRVTSPARSAVEVTTVSGTEASLVYLIYLLHHEFVTLVEIAERYGSMGTWPSTLKTELVLRLATAKLESVGEVRTYLLCYQASIPMPQAQHVVQDEKGREVARVDFAWPQHGVFLEFDGKEKYLKHLRPGESPGDAVFREKKREDLIRRLTGWRCIRLTWADLANPARCAALIRSVLAQQSAA